MYLCGILRDDMSVNSIKIEDGVVKGNGARCGICV